MTCADNWDRGTREDDDWDSHVALTRELDES